MIGRSIIYGLMLAAGLLSPAAAQSDTCPPPAGPGKVTLDVLDPELIRSHEYSANDIMDVSQKRSGIIKIGKSGRTMGLTTYRPTFKLGGRPNIVPVTGGVCVSLAEVQVSYGFEFHEVLVAKEFPVGSCEYQVVLDHEDTHVAFNRQTLKEYSEKVRAELDAAMAKPVAVKTVDAAATINKTLSEIAARLTPIVQEGQKVQQERNAGIDTQFSYFEAFKKCGNWDQGNIFLDGRPDAKAAKTTPASPSSPPPPRPSGDPFGLGKMPAKRD